MKKLNLLGVGVLVLTLSACQATVKSPEVEIEGPAGTKVIIEGDDDNNNSSGSNGTFCPPGQAKKNKC